MKLQELFLTQEDRTQLAMQKLKGLKQAIEDGNAPEIHAATGTIEGPAWGDLRQLGWAEKEQGRSSGTEVEERWVYSADAPGPITLLTKHAKMTANGVERSVKKTVMQPGDATDWITVDYS
jgi:hypothetical protein